MVVKGEVVNFDKFEQKVHAALKKVGNIQPALLAIASDWYKDNKQIANLKGPGMYQPLSRRRAAYKIRKYGSEFPILVATGRMINSILNPKDPEAIYVLGKQTLVLGTMNPYAIYHQSSEPRKVIPYRPIIFNKAVQGSHAKVYETRMKRYTRTIDTYVKKELKKIFNNSRRSI